jgi:hypothetical protein
MTARSSYFSRAIYLANYYISTQPKRFKAENVQQGMVMGPPSATSTPYRSNTPISTPNIPGNVD